MSKGLQARAKKFARGEAMVETSKRSAYFSILQSGKIAFETEKDNPIVLCESEAPMAIGEEVVFGHKPSGTQALALRDCQVIELPIEPVKAQLDASPPAFKALLKGLAERVKSATNDLRKHGTEKNLIPCPPGQTAKVFGIIFHVARRLGNQPDWNTFLNTATVVFQEPATRLEQGLHILAKLGYVAIEADPDPNATAPSHPTDSSRWKRLQFQDLTQIENFFEFYQNYHFRPGYDSFLKTSDKITEMTRALVDLSKDARMDRNGLVQLSFRPTVDAMKEKFGRTFEGDHLYRLEQKGLIVKRITTNDGGILTFLRPEFEQMLLNWKLLREIELWNEKGLVERNDPLPTGAKSPAAGIDSDGIPSEEDVDLSTWTPLILSGGPIRIRTELPKPGELLCPTCLTPVSASQEQCSTCDSALKSS